MLTILILTLFIILPSTVKCADTINIGIMPFSNRIIPGALTRLEVLQEKKNHDYDHLENAMADMMLTELSEGHLYSLVERSRMEDFEKEIKFGETGAIDETTAPKAGKTLGAGYLFYGTVAKQNGTLILTPKLLNINTREEIRIESIRTPETDIIDSIHKIRTLVSRKLPPPDRLPLTRRIIWGASVALLPFNDNSRFKDKEGLKTRMPDKMLNELITTKGLQFVERMRIDAALEELKLNQSGLIDEKTALKIGKLVGARNIIFGSFILAGNMLRIDARLCEVETGKMITAVKAEGLAADAGKVIRSAGVRLKKEFERLVKQ